MEAAQVELAETAGPHSTPPRVHSGFAQGRLSTALASLCSGGMTILFQRISGRGHTQQY